MKKTVLMICFIVLGLSLFAQKSKTKQTTGEIKIPMTSDRWQFSPGGVEFLTYKDVPAMKVSGGDKVILKDFNFANGTIEFDINQLEDQFVGIFFRMANDNETEYFYLRPAQAGNPGAMNTIQYAAYNKGVNLWDLLGYYQGPANIKKDEWNHIKLVISGKQMIVYVNEVNRTTMEIPRLEGNTQSGSIAFNGKSVIANLLIKPDVVEGLSPREGFDPTHHDPRYLRTWQVSEPSPLPQGRELYDGEFPNAETSWKQIAAERRGLINLTRLFGASENRRFVWLRLKLNTTKAESRKVSLGFSDEVWVFLNRQPVFTDKNIFFSPGMRKDPEGRISIDNAQFDIPLRAGENELLVGIANDFYGWGIIARLDNAEGIEVSDNFPLPPAQPKDLSKYFGVYNATEGSLKITITEKENRLMGQTPGQPAVVLEYFEKDKFRLASEGVVLEFYTDEKKMILTQNGVVMTFLRE